jgi:hypothetical protein
MTAWSWAQNPQIFCPSSIFFKALYFFGPLMSWPYRLCARLEANGEALNFPYGSCYLGFPGNGRRAAAFVATRARAMADQPQGSGATPDGTFDETKAVLRSRLRMAAKRG